MLTLPHPFAVLFLTTLGNSNSTSLVQIMVTK
jgi:hypothetical protein